MELKYHQATYNLLTNRPIDTQEAIEARRQNAAIRGGLIADKDNKKIIAKPERILNWTSLDLYRRPIQFSPKNMQQIDTFEHQRGIKIPAAVREWYSLDISPDIMAVRGLGLSIEEFRPMFEIMSLEPSEANKNLWCFLWDEYVDQGGDPIAFEADADDDPPVYAKSGDELVELASTFSEFIYIHFWDWHGHYTFNYGVSIYHHSAVPSLQIPARYHIPLDHLRHNFSEQKSTRGLRFYDEQCRIWAQPLRIWKNGTLFQDDNIITGGTFLTNNLRSVGDLISRIWIDTAPVFEMKMVGTEEGKIIDPLQRNVLRRVLQAQSDWIDAGNLAHLLGASIPVLNSAMMKQMDWLIEHKQAEAHPDNLNVPQSSKQFRARR